MYYSASYIKREVLVSEIIAVVILRGGIDNISMFRDYLNYSLEGLAVDGFLVTMVWGDRFYRIYSNRDGKRFDGYLRDILKGFSRHDMGGGFDDYVDDIVRLVYMRIYILYSTKSIQYISSVVDKDKGWLVTFQEADLDIENIVTNEKKDI